MPFCIANNRWLAAAIWLLACLGDGRALPAAEPPRDYQASVSVSAPTRLDYVFPAANQSPAEPPANWLPAEYDSTAQRYELFVPPDYKAKAKSRYAVMLFISPGAEPTGWSSFEAAARKQKIIFASPFAAGNDCPTQQRVRIVLDVLDDIRRKYRVDPERTYIGGLSGGGRIACAIAFALPEYFGGAMPVCAAGDLRNESWLQQRVIDRLSVALVTGDNDFNLGEVARFRGPMLADVGVRAKVWTVPKMGHTNPDGKTTAEVLQWLDAGANARKKLTRSWPASCVAGDEAATRKEAADALLAEAEKRLKDEQTLYSGLMQLQGLQARWGDLPAGAAAKRRLQEYEALPDHPWEADDIAEQRKFLIARARGIDAYGTGDLPDQYANQRADMLQVAINLWQQVVADQPDSPAGKEGAKRLPVLQKMLDEQP
ncbi:MAG: hypothetical protein AB7I37_22280 [Pirellulales bacterium]